MRSVRYVLGIWIILVMISLPFPFDLLPRVGESLSDILYPINSWILSLLQIDVVQTYSSDSAIYYVQSLVLLITAILIAYPLIKLRTRFNLPSTDTIIVYITAFYLLKYGLIKVVQEQFYTVEPNIAYTPVGQLNKDILFWTSMGTSSVYNIFMGVVEVLAAILLLVPKTRLLGALFSVGIFTHVFVLNLSFDITVKLLSGMLLLSSLYIISRYYRHLVYTFFQKGEPTTHPTIQRRTSDKISSAAALLLILLELMYPIANRKTYHYDSATYQISTNNTKEFKDIKRLHFHSQGYLITESKNQKFEDHKYVRSSTGEMAIANLAMTIKLEEDKMIVINENKSDTIKLQKLNNQTLPIYNDGFHWTVEGMIEDQ